ncbi:aspartate-semialdehyde dehydrogenase, partial [Litorivivens sp.]|uniref:aspartate-semialdehyde dehydrogenase n=1 Tax=Litorivivens sp. TaxID=2020868 RepID=UPI0035641CFB
MKTGLVGWRGMVGSVLMGRMRDENDFANIEPTFYSTSNAGGEAPDVGKGAGVLQDAENIDSLKEMDVIISCQGGDYTKAVFPKLRDAGWDGYWIDAASTLRLADDSIIILDPVNMGVICDGISSGIKTY